jgi:soluble lytic murein transglycosylase
LKKNKKKSKVLIGILIAVIVLAAAFFLLKDVVLKGMYPLDYEKEIASYSKEFSLDPYFVASVIWAESKYDAKAVSSKGAIGLMQIMPDTGEWIAGKLKVKDYEEGMLEKAETNIRFGCWYLRYINDKLGSDLPVVLAAYNAGPGRVEDWLANKEYSKDGVHLDKIPYNETDRYVDKIKRAYEVYKQLYKIQ